MNKETLRMQMLAGVITESQYKQRLNENISDPETKLKDFIDSNLISFSNMSENETEQYSLDEFDNDVVEYLKSVDRFDYENIVVYYSPESNEIYVENNIR